MKTAILLDQYLTEYAEKKIVAVERTRYAVAILTKVLGHYDHMRLTPAVLRRYRASEELAPATINRELGVLSAALGYAKEQGRIRVAPDVPRREGATQRVEWLRPEQIPQLMAASAAYPAIRSFIELALLTGQRLEAILSLRWRQIDFTQGVIWFNDHDLAKADRRKGRAAVPLSARLLDLLKELRNDFPFVLVSARGGRFRDIDRKHWAKIVAAIGMPHITPHDLRHTVATNLIREQVPLIDVSKLLGHASTAITEKIYVNHQPQFLAGAVAKLDTLVGG